MKKFKLGLQLYSIRDEMEKDMDATLKAVKDMGYECVEFAGYFGKTAEEVRALLDKHDLECISVHQGVDLFLQEGQPAYDYLKTIGAKYCAIPWYQVENYRNNWDETMKTFTEVGKKMKENGIQLLYHNHDFEFEKIDGEFILDKMYKTIPEEYLQPQLDVCWVHYAGNNPAEYIAKYNGRLTLLHMKDFACKSLGAGPVYALIDNSGKDGDKPSKEDNGFEYRPVGSGIQNVPEILAAAEAAGVEYIIVEEDESPYGTTLADAKKSIDYLKSLGL